MNAVVQENYEVSMLTIEAVEVHLASLHKGQDELREDVRELRADNKSLREKVDAIHESLDAKIDGVNTSLSAKIDDVNASLNARIDAVSATLTEKISLLGKDVASMRGLQKAMLWVMSGFGSLGLVGKIFHWF
jgi:chromosome segregation ATPase